MDYLQERSITGKNGNNVFGYEKRMQSNQDLTLNLPSLLSIDSLDQIQVGTVPRIYEVSSSGSVLAASGLSQIYRYIHSKYPNKTIIIMDNHNHALYFWTTDIKTKMKRKEENQDKMKNNAISLIHIDQHSDLNSPESRLSLPEVSDQKSSDSTLREYTNNVCQISTFITPFLERFPQTEFTRIKSEYDLLENGKSKIPSDPYIGESNAENQYIILDIDCDFRAPEMSIEKKSETFKITRQLIKNADIITLATSPLFMKQDEALSIIQQLLQ